MKIFQLAPRTGARMAGEVENRHGFVMAGRGKQSSVALMNATQYHAMEYSVARHAWLVVQRPPATPTSFLHMLSKYEVEELQLALARGAVPSDFESKLRRLESGDLLGRVVARSCRLFIALLTAAQNGCFKEATVADCHRLWQVLAYVRKDDDARPDYKPHGFTDDLQEVRSAEAGLEALLKRFKAWRLRHQVPGMWAN